MAGKSDDSPKRTPPEEDRNPDKEIVAPSGIRIVEKPWSDVKPEGWTRFVCFSDTHGREGQIPENHLVPADILLHAGDFTDTGAPGQVARFSEWLQAYPAQHKVVIAGNHDVTFHEEFYEARGKNRFHRNRPFDCSKAKASLTGCTYLEDSATDVCGYHIYGSPWQPEFCDWAFNLPRGEESRKHWDAIPQSVDILMTHGPPHGIGDWTDSNLHAGCEELLAAIRRRAISANVVGHIHEGYGCRVDGATLFINASSCTLQMRPSNPPIVFDAPPPTELRKATRYAADQQAPVGKERGTEAS